jgi:release factor glutamine methyltransferase
MNSVLADTTAQLRAVGCVYAEEEAAILVEAAATAADLPALIERRAAGEPLEQIVGYADFDGTRVTLRPGVFVPRVRSQLLVREAASRARPGDTVVDLCCGSGALGLALLRRVPGIELTAADSDPAAVACARDNLGADRVFQGDLVAALPARLRGGIDVLLANVPYVASEHISYLPAEARLHEPRTALDGGPDGLDVFRAVVAEAGSWLAPGGLALSEITEAQADTAVEIVQRAGLRPGLRHDDELEATVVTATR